MLLLAIILPIVSSSLAIATGFIKGANTLSDHAVAGLKVSATPFMQ